MNPELIARLREVSNMCGGIRALSDKSGINERTLAHWLTGTEPKAGGLAAIAQAAQISLDWLVLGEGPMKRDEGILPAGQARELARATMSLTDTMRSVSREVGEERQRLTEPLRKWTAGHIDVDALAVAQQIADLHLFSATGRAQIVAATYALISDMIQAGIDPAASFEIAENFMARIIFALQPDAADNPPGD